MNATQVGGYTLKELLYEGARSSVYRAERTADAAAVILKFLTVAVPRQIDLTRYRYSKEITDALALDGVASNLDMLDVDGRPVLVGDDIGGQSLGRWIEAGLDRRKLLRSITDVAHTLGQIHAAGVVHRDVNPANIVLEPESGKTQIIDFELASLVPRQFVDAAPATRLEGTLSYIAPEQTGRTGRAVDHRADLYSLGVSLFQVLTGRLPFAAADRLGLVHAHLAAAPPSVCALDPSIPDVLGAIVSRLLEKEPADRYQSGRGLALDLERCLAAMEAGGVDVFELGAHDAPTWLQFGKGLFGRDAETGQLVDAFARTARRAGELVLVAGYSGVGKSSLVMEVQGAVGRAGGRFVEGKYNQYTNVPFAAWAQALESLVGDVLAEPEAAQASIRSRALHALDGLGRVITEWVPEALVLLGEQPELAVLGAGEAQNRFQQTVLRFLSAFASAAHPLTVFLDDLQWADRPSLLLLERLAGDPGTSHIFVVGAYRDNEVPEGHALLRMVRALDEVGAPVSTLRLGPLGAAATLELVQSALGSTSEASRQLADLVFAKTAGNPFFTERFLMSLAEEGALTQRDGAWIWEAERIDAMGFTQNVADLMARRIGRLDARVQEALRVAAAIGNRFDLATLSAVLGWSEPHTADLLWEALKEQVIAPVEGAYRYASLFETTPTAAEGGAEVAYRFEHDRIQEAAYARTAEADRPALHLSIGRALLAAGNDGREFDFAIVTQMNQGRRLLTDGDERRQLLQLNLHAGQHALDGSAYAGAVSFYGVADALLGDDAWTDDYARRYAVSMGLGQATWMCGDFDASRANYDAAIAHGNSAVDRVRALLAKLTAVSVEGDHAACIEMGLTALEHLGFDRPTDEEGWGALGAHEGELLGASLAEGGGVDGLATRPVLDDEDVQLETEVLAALIGPSATIPYIYGVVVTRLVRLFAQKGLGPLAAQGFASFGLLNAFMRDYDTADAFGRVALSLSEQPRYLHTRPAVLMMYGCWICHWKHTVEEAFTLTQESVDFGIANGTFDWAGWSAMNLPTLWLFGGVDLERAEARTREVIATSRNVLKFDDAAWAAYGGLHAILQLRGDVEALAQLDAKGLDEPALHERLAHYPMMRAPMYTGRLLAAILLRQPEVAAACIENCAPIALYGGGLIHVAEFTFLEALAALDAAADVESVREKVEAAIAQLDGWADHAPATHGCKPKLLRAQLAVLAGEDASDLFEEAIDAAAQGGMQHLQALCLERAGMELIRQGRRRAARGYLLDARILYLRWGAVAKVEAMGLEQSWLLGGAGSLGTGTMSTSMTSTSATSSTSVGSSLDSDALVRSMAAISSDLHMDGMLETVMSTMLHAAGAERGSLLVLRDDQFVVAAQAEGDEVCMWPEGPVAYSAEIVAYVIRTRSQVVLPDAAKDRRFGAAAYVVERSPRSVLCQPILQQGKVVAVLYLENNLAADSFTRDRCQVLGVLAGQFSISYENARLYHGMEREVARQTVQLREQNEELGRALADLRAAQDQLVHAEKMASLGALTAGVAHELNNPLNFVNNFADSAVELLEELKAEESETERDELFGELSSTLAAIGRSGARASGIVSSMARHAGGTGRMRELIDLNQLVRRHAGGRDGVQIRVDLDGDLGQISVVPQELSTVLANMLDNAVDAVSDRADGAVVVRTRGDGEWIELAVQDNGRGVPEELRQRIFEPFFTTKAGAEGTGLGLSMCYEIVVQGHGGTIECTSADPGTRFTVRLPAGAAG